MKVYSIHFNKPEFATMQARTFRHFLPEHDLIIVNNARDPSIECLIAKAAEAEGVACINPGIPYPGLEGLSHQAALAWVVGHMIGSSEIVMIVDHDIFPIEPFDPQSFLGHHHIAGVPQQIAHAAFPWPGLLIFDMARLGNHEEIFLEGGYVDGVNIDTGGQLHRYLTKYNVPWRGMDTTSQIREPKNGDGVPEDLRESYDFAYGFELFLRASCTTARDQTGTASRRT